MFRIRKKEPTPVQKQAETSEVKVSTCNPFLECEDDLDITYFADLIISLTNCGNNKPNTLFWSRAERSFLKGIIGMMMYCFPVERKTWDYFSKVIKDISLGDYDYNKADLSPFDDNISRYNHIWQLDNNTTIDSPFYKDYKLIVCQDYNTVSTTVLEVKERINEINLNQHLSDVFGGSESILSIINQRMANYFHAKSQCTESKKLKPVPVREKAGQIITQAKAYPKFNTSSFRFSEDDFVDFD